VFFGAFAARVNTALQLQAMEMYKEALRQSDSHSKSMQALAKLYLSRNDSDACQQLCAQLLKMDPDNHEAAIMLAELMFHKASTPAAG
jgi:tetratricopeptide repeat protein 21B